MGAIRRAAKVMHLQDIRVLERRHGACLLLKSGSSLGIIRHMLGQHLHRHFSGEAQIRGRIDGTHAASADELLDAVT